MLPEFYLCLFQAPAPSRIKPLNYNFIHLYLPDYSHSHMTVPNWYIGTTAYSLILTVWKQTKIVFSCSWVLLPLQSWTLFEVHVNMTFWHTCYFTPCLAELYWMSLRFGKEPVSPFISTLQMTLLIVGLYTCTMLAEKSNVWSVTTI